MEQTSTKIRKHATKWVVGSCGCGCSLPLVGILLLIMVCCSIMTIFASDESQGQGAIQEQYSNYVMQYSMEFDVPPALVYAVIKAESGFNPNAVSSVGARGLMQMLPSTFESMKNNFFPEDTYTSNDLFTPEVSIKYGTKYLSETLKKYGVKETAIASYNAGQGAVDSWLKNSTYSDDGKTLKYIPYSETRAYVETVMKYYNEYLQQVSTNPEAPVYPDISQPSEFGFIWPCPGTTVITSYWGDGRNHKGLDVSGADCYGKPIVAVQDGTVTWANHSGWGGGYGLGAYISHGNGISTRYAHMSQCLVNVGDTVKQGQVIGYIGNTGDSYGAHLHSEVRINDVAVDALKYLPSPQ